MPIVSSRMLLNRVQARIRLLPTKVAIHRGRKWPIPWYIGQDLTHECETCCYSFDKSFNSMPGCGLEGGVWDIADHRMEMILDVCDKMNDG
jgi:hypothetical protein